MYQFQKKSIEAKVHKYLLFRETNQLHYSDFIALLRQDKKFRSFFIHLLSNVDFHAYQWETPPVTSNTADQPFEFVVSRRPAIDLPPDPGPFQQYFEEAEDEIAVFKNLGNDARLIAPAPNGDLNYSHIGIFTEEAPEQLQHSLWQTVGNEIAKHLSDQPVWLNTAGGGVAWLHVRLDSRPKYYRHHPYTRFR